MDRSRARRLATGSSRSRFCGTPTPRSRLGETPSVPQTVPCSIPCLALLRHRLWLSGHAGARQHVVCHGRRAGGTLRFGRQPPLRFVVLLVLAGSFLFTLLKGRAGFFRHPVHRLNGSSRARAPLSVRYTVSCSAASVR